MPPVVGAAPQTAPAQDQFGMVQPHAQQSPTPDELRAQTLDQALRQIAPATPEEIYKLRGLMNEITGSETRPLYNPQPVTRSLRVSLNSGERPPVIKVAPGWISTLTFSGITGQPWPVNVVANGNPEVFRIQQSGTNANSNILTISSASAHLPSNIAITLADAPVPVVFTLQPSTEQVDYRIDVQIAARGPNAIYGEVTTKTLPPTSDSLMLRFLDGLPPEEARKLHVNTRGVEAWMYKDKMHVRTTASLLSPAPIAKSSNASGIHVYVLNQSPVLLLSQDGQMYRASVTR
ncbi:DotH/IcmK family type IV secretion protein [Pseudovibrio ascidiaceicola]|uniref:DotH/IcmK family type IV secretion protein n=1 Tax=Pseudovibrio ascidiaceicola TaxID=285279 RepID=UPI003D36DFCB